MIIPFEKIAALLDLKKTESDYADLALIKSKSIANIENYLQRWLTSADYEETVAAQTDSTRMIPLQALPVQSVTTVLVDGVETTGYLISAYGIRLNSAIKEKSVFVSYTGGYETLPDVLESAMLTQICYDYQQKNNLGITTISSDGGTIIRPKGAILPEVKEVLEMYKHPYREF